MTRRYQPPRDNEHLWTFKVQWVGQRDISTVTLPEYLIYVMVSQDEEPGLFVQELRSLNVNDSYFCDLLDYIIQEFEIAPVPLYRLSDSGGDTDESDEEEN